MAEGAGAFRPLDRAANGRPLGPGLIARSTFSLAGGEASDPMGRVQRSCKDALAVSKQVLGERDSPRCTAHSS